jgi:hypothetical protein
MMATPKFGEYTLSIRALLTASGGATAAVGSTM